MYIVKSQFVAIAQMNLYFINIYVHEIKTLNSHRKN
jgi:hypothetical protein